MQEDQPRLRTELWVQAFLRACAVRGDFAAVYRRGDLARGAVLVRISSRQRLSCLYSQTRQTDGSLAWMPLGIGLSDEQSLEMIERQMRYDEDLWVVDVDMTETAPEELLGAPVLA